MQRWVLSTAEPVPGVHLVSSLHLWAGKSLNRHSFLHSPRGTTSMGTGRGDSKKSLQLQCQPPRPPPQPPLLRLRAVIWERPHLPTPHSWS